MKRVEEDEERFGSPWKRFESLSVATASETELTKAISHTKGMILLSGRDNEEDFCA